MQLYIKDEKASIMRPVKELQGFRKVTLLPGGTKTVSFTLGRDNLAFYNKSMNLVLEPGTFRVMMGSSSEDIREQGFFKITK